MSNVHISVSHRNHNVCVHFQLEKLKLNALEVALLHFIREVFAFEKVYIFLIRWSLQKWAIFEDDVRLNFKAFSNIYCKGSVSERLLNKRMLWWFAFFIFHELTSWLNISIFWMNGRLNNVRLAFLLSHCGCW